VIILIIFAAGRSIVEVSPFCAPFPGKQRHPIHLNPKTQFSVYSVFLYFIGEANRVRQVETELQLLL
jgi:hypothetical protein